MTGALVIGYGTVLRRDDGAGPAVAERFVDRPGVRVIVAHQLTPELAVELALCRRVIFVDAERGADRVSVRPVAGASRPDPLGHGGTPERLMALAFALYGARPEARVVTVPAADLTFGEGLSDVARGGVGCAVELIEGIVTGRPAAN